MDTVLEVRYPKKRMKAHLMERLTTGRCNLFLPISFVCMKGETLGSISLKGYQPLTRVGILPVKVLLLAILELINRMRGAEEQCFWVGEYALLEKVVFYNTEEKDLALLYWPWHYADQTEFRRTLDHLMEVMEDHLAVEDRYPLEHIRKFVRNEGMPLAAISHQMELWLFRLEKEGEYNEKTDLSP